MPDRPNIVLILTDHFRGDCLSRRGHPVADTPNIDGLSREGAVFTNGYTPCPSCTPARRSLMTGMTPYSAGLIGYEDREPWDYDHTLAGELRDAGYQTVNIGKTHFRPSRLHLGFEGLTTPADYREWLDDRPDLDAGKTAHGVDSNSWVGRPNHLPEHMMEETWFVSRAREFLEKRDPTRPFFLCLSFTGPHPPWCPPRTYYEEFIDRDLPDPVVGEWAQRHAEEAEYPMDVNAWRGEVSDRAMQRARAAYFGYLSYIDAQVGRFVQSLGATDRGTFTLFTSDHGEMLGDHNLWRKTYAYEASANVPFVVRFHDGLDAERNVELDAVVGWEDIMPTLLDVGDTPVPDTVEGRSLLPLLRGEDGCRSFYHGEHSPCYHEENANQFLTDGRWKYIWNPITGEEQLFDLASDPHECRDRSGDPSEADTLETWRNRLVEELADREDGLSDGESLHTGPVTAWVEEMPD